MSHFTKVKTSIRDLDCLLEALKAMGYDSGVIEQGNITIQDYYGAKQKANVVIRKANLKGSMGRFSDMGFVRNEDGTYEMIADGFYPDDLHKWTNELTQNYALNVVIKTTGYQGYMPVEQQKMQDGSIRLVMRQW